MNIITDLINRIEDYRTTNKNPCKNYATQASAEKATLKMAEIVGEHHMTSSPADYVVFYNEAWGRWVGAINLSELMRRSDYCGGYVGLAGSKGFFTF